MILSRWLCESFLSVPTPNRGEGKEEGKGAEGKEKGRRREGEGKEKGRRREGEGKEKGRRREGEGKKKGEEVLRGVGRVCVGRARGGGGGGGCEKGERGRRYVHRNRFIIRGKHVSRC